MKQFNKKAVILGAGPAGLSVAYELIASNSGIQPIIIDKLDCVGGLSRTVYGDGFGVDIGGHRLYTKDKYIKSIWDKFLTVQNFPSKDDIYLNRNVKYPKIGKNPADEDDVMLIRNRFSSIIYNSNFFPYPLKLNFDLLKKLGFKTSIFAMFSYFKSLIFKREEKNLEDFLINRFGSVLYNIFFKDYTKKVWGVEPSILSSEWGHQRIRKVSLFKAVLNSIAQGFSFLNFSKEHSFIDKFYYPKYGCSQLWNLMADYIVKNGGLIIHNCEFSEFNYNQNKLMSVKIKNNGKIQEVSGNYFVSTIPIKDLIVGFDAPFNIKQHALNLPYRDYILVSFYTDKFNLKNYTDYKTINDITPDCWIYLQEKDAIASRIQIMNNWSPYLVSDYKNKYLISLEFFANVGDEIWSMNDKDIIKLAQLECKKYNLFNSDDVIKSFVIREQKAYPSYFGAYKNIDLIREYILSRFDNIYLSGRNGRHIYCNMDEAMLSGINTAREIIEKMGANGK